MLPLASVFAAIVRPGRGGGPLLPVSVARPAVAKATPLSGSDGARAPRSPVREEGLGWAEAGWKQPGVVVLVAGR